MRDTIHKGIIGVIAPTTGYAISVSTVEIWLRIGSLVIGIIVGILSGVSIWLSIRRKLRRNRAEEEPTTL